MYISLLFLGGVGEQRKTLDKLLPFSKVGLLSSWSAATWAMCPWQLSYVCIHAYMYVQIYRYVDIDTDTDIDTWSMNQSTRTESSTFLKNAMELSS